VRQLVPTTHGHDRFQVECYLCGTWLDAVSNGTGAAARRQRYEAHLTQVHGDLGQRARSVLADAMLRHERKVGLR
jgi:hypothetical protein